MSRAIECKPAPNETLPPELLLEVFAEPIMFHPIFLG